MMTKVDQLIFHHLVRILVVTSSGMETLEPVLTLMIQIRHASLVRCWKTTCDESKDRQDDHG